MHLNVWNNYLEQLSSTVYNCVLGLQKSKEHEMGCFRRIRKNLPTSTRRICRQNVSLVTAGILTSIVIGWCEEGKKSITRSEKIKCKYQTFLQNYIYFLMKSFAL